MSFVFTKNKGQTTLFRAKQNSEKCCASLAKLCHTTLPVSDGIDLQPFC